MSENYALAIIAGLFGLIQAVIAVILSWIATELRQIRQKLDTKVEKADCTTGMCRHETEIRNLWENTRSNTERIIKIEVEK